METTNNQNKEFICKRCNKKFSFKCPLGTKCDGETGHNNLSSFSYCYGFCSGECISNKSNKK